jgi:phosphonate transport system permease protein
VLVVLVACCWAVWQLDLSLAELFPGGRLTVFQRFFAAAFTPDLSAEVLAATASATWQTLVFAVAAMVLALALGVVLGFLGSTAWWSGEAVDSGRGTVRLLRRTAFPALYLIARLITALLRSIHELFWALLLLVSMGATNPLSGVIAIAIPYGCTLAKVFAEMVDEAPQDAAMALRLAGASPMQVYCFGLLPSAALDMTAYAFYRFECTLRSAAILGFFGFGTLGLFIQQSFSEVEYAQTWTFLYALLAMVIAADWWSGAFRRSFAN